MRRANKSEGSERGAGDGEGSKRHMKPRAAGDQGESPEGVLVLDKPVGITSMTAVEVVRRRAGGVRTGHAGTLDPLASGVLVVALGRATKLIDRLMATDKRYRTEIDLSAFTTTDDAQGEREEPAFGSAAPGIHDVRAAILRFVGTFPQRPPAFSAVKIGGKRAYKLARQGQPPVIAPRPVTVHSIELIRYEWPRLEIDIHCAKGFYVRSLARDLGGALGTGGYCASIRRTAVGPFTLAMATALADLPATLNTRELIAPEAAMRMIGDR